MPVSCAVPKQSEVTEFRLHCETKTLYLQTRTTHGTLKTFPVDLTPLFTGCDGEDLFPLIDTRLANPTVSEINDDKVRVEFEIINVANNSVVGVEFFYVPVISPDEVITDHTLLTNIGVNDHATLDLHLADVTTNPHAVSYDNIGGTQPAPLAHTHDAGKF